MMNQLTRKRNQKGFTLMEMLIVVAIIAILVAISIPVFTSQLDNARLQTDAANERAAKAAAVTVYLTADPAPTLPKTYYYDAVNGVIKETNSGITPYGKASTHATNNIVSATIAVGGGVTTAWVPAA